MFHSFCWPNCRHFFIWSARVPGLSTKGFFCFFFNLHIPMSPYINWRAWQQNPPLLYHVSVFMFLTWRSSYASNLGPCLHSMQCQLGCGITSFVFLNWIFIYWYKTWFVIYVLSPMRWFLFTNFPHSHTFSWNLDCSNLPFHIFISKKPWTTFSSKN